jgi:hypothetical protein
MRDSMIIYRSFYEAIKDLKKEEQGEVWNAIYSYALDFQEVELKGICKTVFTLIKPQLDANIAKFKNGKKEKQNRSKTEANDKQNRSKTEGNVNDNENHNENKNDIESHNEIFKKLWVNRMWLESLAMLWKKEISEIRKHLNRFRLECISKEDFKISEKDAKEHFVNWTKYNPIPEPQGYVFKRPDLSSLERNPF